MDQDNEQFRLQKKHKENERLWQDFQIDFRLEAFKFPDNKIYGTVNIIPESARKLIEKFILVVNKINRIEFEPAYKHLSASGFNTNRKNPSAYIEAIPYNTKYLMKTSKICYFFFTGEVFALSPTISFDWSKDEENSTAELVINWYHIGDKLAQKYILCLDDTEIQYIRQKLIDDAFEVRISGFESRDKHTFQLAARLNNGKETYRSDLMEFIVPDKELNDEDSIEFITVLNEPPPPNLPAFIATKDDKVQEDFNQVDVNPNKKKEENINPNKKSEENLNRNKTQLKQKINKKIYTCCKDFPHSTFPGIEHYFNNMIHKLSSSEEDTE